VADRLPQFRITLRRGAVGQIFRQLHFRPHRLQVIDRRIGGDAPRPSAETAPRIEARVAAIDAPERLDGEVVGNLGLADNPQNPATDFVLELPEERFERRGIAKGEPLQQEIGFRVRRCNDAGLGFRVRNLLLSCLTVAGQGWFQTF
jgi:hypothetical protein